MSEGICSIQLLQTVPLTCERDLRPSLSPSLARVEPLPEISIEIRQKFRVSKGVVVMSRRKALFARRFGLRVGFGLLVTLGFELFKLKGEHWSTHPIRYLRLN